MEQEVESAYYGLNETVEKYLNSSSYAIVNLTELFSGLMGRNKFPGMDTLVSTSLEVSPENDDEEDEF